LYDLIWNSLLRFGYLINYTLGRFPCVFFVLNRATNNKEIGPRQNRFPRSKNPHKIVVGKIPG